MGAQASTLRRLDNLSADVSGAERAAKQSETEYAAKLHLQAQVGR